MLNSITTDFDTIVVNFIFLFIVMYTNCFRGV